MLNAFALLLCSKLCWHNRLKPNQYASVLLIKVTEGTFAISLICAIDISLLSDEGCLQSVWSLWNFICN